MCCGQSIKRLLLAFAMASTSLLSGSFKDVKAQAAGDARSTSEPTAQEPAPSSEPARGEPTLQLQLNDAGVDVVPPPARTPDGYTLEQMELRVKRARIGSGIIAVIATGVLLANRSAERAKLQEANYHSPRRVQWGLARSRLVF